MMAVVALPAAAAAFQVVGDAIPAPLTDVAGDPVRGRAVVAGRQVGTCVPGRSRRSGCRPPSRPICAGWPTVFRPGRSGCGWSIPGW